jgi:hypothetical protein
MGSHEGVNPNTAADLLRQAMMQSRSDDDTHDQIGISQPASGIATPRPDLSDKRLPSIMHNFFQQNTPPHTPRGTTSAGNTVEKQSLSAITQPILPGIPSVPYNGNSNNVIAPGGPVGTIAATAPGSGAAVGPPKGKLTVRIIEARGLRPSQDPYVVCVFEWNEYISKGPRRRETDLEQDEGNRVRDDSGGMRIGAGDMGRRIAIPMKSRQSSNTSLPDHKEFNRDGKTTSNPKWEQEAVLYDLDHPYMWS